MNDRRQILVVARNPKLAERLVAWLQESGRETTLVTTFADARARLDAPPDLVITEVKLGEYNGLHVALKAQAAGIPAVIIGPPDSVLQRDAESIQAVYLTAPGRGAVLGAVSRLLDPPASESPSAVLPFRAHVTTVPAEAEVMWRAFAESPASVLDAFGRTMLPN